MRTTAAMTDGNNTFVQARQPGLTSRQKAAVFDDFIKSCMQVVDADRGSRPDEVQDLLLEWSGRSSTEFPQREITDQMYRYAEDHGLEMRKGTTTLPAYTLSRLRGSERTVGKSSTVYFGLGFQPQYEVVPPVQTMPNAPGASPSNEEYEARHVTDREPGQYSSEVYFHQSVEGESIKFSCGMYDPRSQS